ncbi:hypothetical protein [Paracoccus sp. ME4]|uniref:hypothetical protein n=1 Tax=Paracoccus sp. ME4 TaxID=3138066 RepID=UPI00398ADF18
MTTKGPLRTPDGRYIIVRGQLWRATDPALDPIVHARQVTALMTARRAVKTALSAGDKEAEAQARRAVDDAKTRLGERGRVWWDDGAPDLGRRMVRNTPYAQWFAGLDFVNG